MGVTIPVYFTDDEKAMLNQIDKAKKVMHMSRSGWIKWLIEKELKVEKKEK